MGPLSSHLHTGVQRTWKRLVDGHCGVFPLKDKGKAFEQQQCQVAGLVPEGKKEDGGWTVSEWLSGDVRLIWRKRGRILLIRSSGTTPNVEIHGIRYGCLPGGS